MPILADFFTEKNFQFILPIKNSFGLTISIFQTLKVLASNISSLLILTQVQMFAILS